MNKDYMQLFLDQIQNYLCNLEQLFVKFLKILDLVCYNTLNKVLQILKIDYNYKMKNISIIKKK